MKYDLERLNTLDIKDVLEALGARPSNNRNVFHCFNVAAHKDSDNSASMGIYPKSNSCRCFACGISGMPVNVAKEKFGGSSEGFKKACEFLHSHFGVPTLDNNPVRQIKVTMQAKATPKKVLMEFDENKEFVKVGELDNFVKLYNKMSDRQKLKLVYTSLYRFSLGTHQDKKEAYYLKRGIKKLELVDNIGFLTYLDVKNLQSYLLERFPTEDLIRFKLFSAKTKAFNYAFNVAVVPNFDLYSDMVVGFSFRSIDPTYRGAKEVNVWCNDIAYAMPFGLTYDSLKNCEWIWICEGHIDCLSLKQYYENSNKVCFIAFNGVYGYKREFLNLLKGKKRVVLSFDKDTAGISGEKALSEALNSLRIYNLSARWDFNDGVDLNDLLMANKLNTLTFGEAV